MTYMYHETDINPVLGGLSVFELTRKPPTPLKKETQWVQIYCLLFKTGFTKYSVTTTTDQNTPTMSNSLLGTEVDALKSPYKSPNNLSVILYPFNLHLIFLSTTNRPYTRGSVKVFFRFFLGWSQVV